MGVNMEELLYYFKIYIVRFKYSFKIFSNSFINFCVGIIAFLLIQLGGLLFINIIFNQIPQINGFNFNQVIALYAFAQITRGLDHFYSDYLWFFAANGIVNGMYDKYLTRPLNPLFQIIIEKVQFDAIGEIVTGVVLYIYSLNALNIGFSFSLLLKTIFFIIIGCVIYTCLKIICTSFAFFIKRSFTVVKAVYSVSDFAKYPITIYPKWIQIILTYILAYGLTSYYPIKYILIEPFKVIDLVQVLIITGMLILITKIFWQKGEKNYESSGS